MGKLVRDRIPDIIRADGRTPRTRILSTAEYRIALLDKLIEEARELRDAAPVDRPEEAADVYEVLLALTAEWNVSIAEVAAAAETKRAERGGFVDRIWLD